MPGWTDWPFERFSLLFLSVGFAMVWLQVFLLHARGAFHRPAMYLPVLLTPVLALTALAAGIWLTEAVDLVYAFIFGLGAFVGVVGSLLHLVGVGSMIGGVNVRNLMAGPPVFLPLMLGALSAFALVAALWWRIA